MGLAPRSQGGCPDPGQGAALNFGVRRALSQSSPQWVTDGALRGPAAATGAARSHVPGSRRSWESHATPAWRLRSPPAEKKQEGNKVLLCSCYPVPVPENSKLSAPHESGFVHSSAPTLGPWLGLVPRPGRQDLINPQSGQGPAKDLGAGTLASRPPSTEPGPSVCSETLQPPPSTQQERGLRAKGHGLRPQTRKALETRVQAQTHAQSLRVDARHPFQEGHAGRADGHVWPIPFTSPICCSVTRTPLNGLSLGPAPVPCARCPQAQSGPRRRPRGAVRAIGSGRGVLSSREPRGDTAAASLCGRVCGCLRGSVARRALLCPRERPASSTSLWGHGPPAGRAHTWGPLWALLPPGPRRPPGKPGLCSS